MIRKYLKRWILINKQAILMEVLSIEGLMQLLMKIRNREEKWTREVPYFSMFLQKSSTGGKPEGGERRRWRIKTFRLLLGDWGSGVRSSRIHCCREGGRRGVVV
jgi:hypothetical protein